MFKMIKSDFRAVLEMDPAATSKLAVIFTYSGFHAILAYRLAHRIHRLGMPFFARLISQTARFLTGIEIHPGAQIGGHFFIDHGMGVVIGETSEIGEHVVLFQGVTLGGTGKERGKRHPTLGSHVVIGAGAKILGGITIGDNVKVGANAVVLKSVPAHSTVVGVPGRVVKQHGQKAIESEMLDHVHMPDPLYESLTRMQKQIARLEQKLGIQGGGEQVFELEQAGKQGGRQGQSSRKGRKGQTKVQLSSFKGVEVEALPVETVQERQARMARMEKEERMKMIAFKKARDAASQNQEQPEAEEGAAAASSQQPQKKKSRRRRRPRKPGGQQGVQGQGQQGEGQGSEGGGQSGEAATVSFATKSDSGNWQEP